MGRRRGQRGIGIVFGAGIAAFAIGACNSDGNSDGDDTGGTSSSASATDASSGLATTSTASSGSSSTGGLTDVSGTTAAPPLPDIDVQAHRGDRGNVPPGNTMPSFTSALALGVDTLEGDMHITSDGRVVMGHDPDLLTTGCVWAGSGPAGSSSISAITLDELGNWDCHAELDGVQSPPTVEEVLAMDDVVAFNLEFKLTTPASVDIYMQALVDYDASCNGCLDGRLTVQSFSWEMVEYAKTNYTRSGLNFRGSVLALAVDLELIGEATAYAEIWSPADALVTETIVEQVHALGLEVVPWTVDDPDRMQTLTAMGVDGIISNFPDVLLQYAQ